MPLMQLSTLVLPAPFGPISARSSRRSTASVMPSSTTRPPNRSRKSSTASSAIPSPAAPILLDRAVARARAALRLAEIELLNVAVRAQSRAVAVENAAAVLEDVAVIGNRQRRGGILLDQHDGQPEIAPDLDQSHHQFFDDGGGEAKRQFIDQEQFRAADERAPQRQHLPLAAGKKTGGPAAQIGEARECMIDELLAVASSTRRRRERRSQILGHREVRKHLVA